MNQPDFLKGPQIQQTTKAWVEFYLHCEVDKEATERAGFKIYKDVDFAMMVSQNGNRKIPVKATDQHKAQFPKAWEAYQKRRDLTRTNLQIIGLRPSQIMDLQRFDIDCLEHLAKSNNHPAQYQKYKDAAELIVKLRLQNDKELQSGGNAERERQDLRVTPDQQVHNNQGIGSQKGYKEEVQKINFGSFTCDIT